MVFSSPRFFVFLAFTLFLLSWPTISSRSQKLTLAFCSCLFYAAWDWRYLGLLLSISVIDYLVARRIYNSTESGARTAWLWVSICSNLGILAYFKYLNFFIENLNNLGLTEFSVRAILLPAGISFYTFKTLSYTIDVYRRELEPCDSILDYTTFVTFFPELIAGPIVRASIFIPQMGRRIGPTRTRLAEGASIFLLGLTKKLFIADRMATIADPIFLRPEIFTSGTVWVGVLAYTIQIYCDFSGYSDMAIGSARMIGYDLPQNFNMPYLSLSITEFWRRWHITLSSWLRDYLYIPLGGNRHGTFRTYINLMLTMLLGGLWHGASWNFVLWGGMHGVALAVHKLLMGLPAFQKIPRLLAWLGTLLFVIFTWVPFRSVSWDTTLTIFEKMLGLSVIPDQGAANWIPLWFWLGLALTVVGHGLGTGLQREAHWLVQTLKGLGARIDKNAIAGSYAVMEDLPIAGAFVVSLWVLILYFFSPTDTSPFIYFQF
jgi:alginate O-acetyltransferase complex protein AlgI